MSHLKQPHVQKRQQLEVANGFHYTLRFQSDQQNTRRFTQKNIPNVGTIFSSVKHFELTLNTIQILSDRVHLHSNELKSLCDTHENTHTLTHTQLARTNTQSGESIPSIPSRQTGSRRALLLLRKAFKKKGKKANEVKEHQREG